MNKPKVGYTFSDPRYGLSGYRYVVLAVSPKAILTQAYTCTGDKLGVPTWSPINEKWFSDEWRVPYFEWEEQNERPR